VLDSGLRSVVFRECDCQSKEVGVCLPSKIGVDEFIHASARIVFAHKAELIALGKDLEYFV